MGAVQRTNPMVNQRLALLAATGENRLRLANAARQALRAALSRDCGEGDG